jgi:hypothetical protein
MTTTPVNLYQRALDLAETVDEMAFDLETAELLAEDESTVGIYNSTASVLLWIAGRIENATGCTTSDWYDVALDDLPEALVVDRVDSLREHIDRITADFEQGLSHPAEADFDAILGSLALIDGGANDPVVLDEALMHLQVARDRRDPEAA